MTDYAKAIDSVFVRFNVSAHVDNMTVGPSVVRYECSVGRGVKVNKISGLQAEIAYETAAKSVRIEAPIPGKSAVGIELPREDRELVTLADIECEGIPIGKNIEGNAVTTTLEELPHLLVAGTTGSGKSSFIHAALLSLLKADPAELQMTLIDVKQIELTPYDGIAHLRQPVITEVDDAVLALRELCDEMEFRFAAMRTAGARTIEGLGFPKIAVVVDELADLLMQARSSADYLTRLAQKSRAAGIHLIVSTQRPSADVIPSRLKTNLPSRLAFATASAVDSRVVLDGAGAEQLLGKGDGLWKPIGARDAVRVQGALVTDEEIAEAVAKAAPDDVPTEVFQPVSVEHSPRNEPSNSTVRRVFADPLDEIIRKADRAAENAGKYRRWIPSLEVQAAKNGRTLHESEAVTKLILELESARQELADVAEQLKALKGMEAVA